MPGTNRAGGYRHLFPRPAALRTFALALVGRLAYGMLPLLLLFTVQNATGSFTVAATSSALFGVGALLMPVQSRAIDRFGQARVLPLTATTFAVVLVIASVLAARSVALPPVWLAVGAVLGAVAPALGPSMRAQWRSFAPDDAQVVTAYALDGACEESLYLAGPLLASGFLATGAPWRGLPVVAAMIVVGALGLAASPFGRHTTTRAPADGDADHRGWLGPLHRPVLRSLLLLMTSFGFAVAAMNTSVAAAADRTGHPEYAGIAAAVIAAGSTVGGLSWGKARPRIPWRASLALLLGVLGLGLGAAWLSPTFVVLAASVGVAGLAVGPTYIVGYSTADALVAQGERTEAITWVTTVTNLGVALGSAAAGALVDRAGPQTPLGVAAVVAAAGATGALLVPMARRRRS